jgi:hypothetical protein
MEERHGGGRGVQRQGKYFAAQIQPLATCCEQQALC